MNQLINILTNKDMETTRTTKRPRIKGGRGEHICMVTPQKEIVAFSAASEKEVYKRALNLNR